MAATRSATGEVAKEINAQIRAIAGSFAGSGDDHQYTFFCECGCMRPVTLSLAAFAAAERALVVGHRGSP